MQSSLPFLDIIIFAIIAVFLIYRLKNILGQNSESNSDDNFLNTESKKYTNVVNLNKDNLKKDNKVETNLEKIISANPDFNEQEFLSGAKTFFEMVIKCFVKGNLDDVNNYIDQKLLNNFQSAIDERLEEKESLTLNISNINLIQIKNVEVIKNLIRISVLFETTQIKILKDKNGKVIDGDQENDILVRDVWTFERNSKSKDLNWKLVETRDA